MSEPTATLTIDRHKSTRERGPAPDAHPPREVRVAIVGSGFSGLGMAIRLEQAGIEDYVVLERADDVGGTWRDNTYPGAACDVPSHLYSFSFDQNPDWTRTFSSQPEIQAYLRGCAERHGVLPRVLFGHEVTGARWDAGARRWRVSTSRGEFTAHVLVGAQGALCEPMIPALPGLESFEGRMFHSARWDHSHSLAGERVAVVGTGASAIQFVPEIQPLAGRVDVYQRTPPWIVPRADRPITRIERLLFRRFPAAQRMVRSAIYWARESFVLGFAFDRRIMRAPRAIALKQLGKQVRDPELRAKLTPSYEIGCKRILISNDWYPALTKPNVDVVTDGIREVRPRSIVTADGVERATDTIIFGTGFHVTDPPIAALVRGADGRTLRETWADGMKAYLGTSIAGFPNLFFMTGPNTGLGHTSMTVMIEAQVGYVLAALATMERDGIEVIDVRRDVMERFDARIQKRLERTVWNAGGCASWYLDARGRNSTLWPTFTFSYARRLRRFDVSDYEVRVGAPVAR